MCNTSKECNKTGGRTAGHHAAPALNFRNRGRRSEDENSGKHHQYNNRNTERQELTGHALEIARTFVVLQCHGCLPYTIVRTSGFERGARLRAAQRSRLMADLALLVVRAHHRTADATLSHGNN